MAAVNYNRPIIFFDGVCNLCNRSVQFVVRHDKRGAFLFAPLQSAAGKDAIAALAADAPANGIDSVVLAYQGRYYTKSAAALHTFRLLGGLWQLLYVFIIIPPFIRNLVYDLIARNRYRWFGKRDECIVPTPELRDRFLQ